MNLRYKQPFSCKTFSLPAFTSDYVPASMQAERSSLWSNVIKNKFWLFYLKHYTRIALKNNCYGADLNTLCVFRTICSWRKNLSTSFFVLSSNIVFPLKPSNSHLTEIAFFFRLYYNFSNWSYYLNTFDNRTLFILYRVLYNICTQKN